LVLIFFSNSRNFKFGSKIRSRSMSHYIFPKVGNLIGIEFYNKLKLKIMNLLKFTTH
jgi:hypothetical protein